MTPANWQNGTPSQGDQLIFPATGVAAASFTNVNNFPAGTTFQSITFQAAGKIHSAADGTRSALAWMRR
jgi:hypothetical protein